MANQQEKVYIYGRHALMEALIHRPHAVKKAFLDASIQDPELKGAIRKAGATMGTLSEKALRGVGARATHQGIIGVLSLGGLILSYKQFVNKLSVNEDTALILLDEIQDPHNVGAIIRSAAAFGISGVLIPEHNQAPVTGAVVKVSAGTVFQIPLVSIGNVNETVRDLKKNGFWIYGLEAGGTHSLPDERFDSPAVFILGNESEGIRQKTRELCDILLSIPMNPKCESLNVAAGAAVGLYAWSIQHVKALKKI